MTDFQKSNELLVANNNLPYKLKDSHWNFLNGCIGTIKIHKIFMKMLIVKDTCKFNMT